ncbi:MAG: immunoglobulin domain-containing protein, partial [Verrucomicrobia bacterium]|nr:immunoglobulin domain-containing protein [Verrucomicrobiota bacterium]
YVADPSSHVIRKITPAGVVTTFAGTAGSPGSADGIGSAARFNSPSGVAVDGSGNIYVADTNNHVIRGISQAGNVITLAGTAGATGSADGLGTAARFNYPFAVAVDTFGTLYVADTFNHMIRRIAPNGTVSTVAGSAGIRGTADGSGAGARFAFPMGLVVDSSGVIYVADSANGSIRKIVQGNPSVVTTYAGVTGQSGTADGAGATVARFNQPNSVTVDTAGVVYVADTMNHTIRRIATTQEVTTLAGLAGTVGSTDGTGTAARFSQPMGITVDSSGNLYIADSQNRTIRRSGAVTGAVIATQPTNASAAPGSNASFSVVATGSPQPTFFQWQRKPADASTDFVNLPNDATYSGSNSATLTVVGVTQTMNNDQFRVIVSNFVNPDAVSNPVTLSTVISAPAFTSVASTSFRATQLGAFTVAASGNPAPTFSATGLPTWLTLNATTGVLSGTAPDTTGSPFTLTITANNGVPVTQTFVLTVTPAVVAPVIVQQPVGGALNRGQNAVFTVTVTGTDPLVYQWNKDGQPLAGATSSSLTLNGVQPINAGVYTVTVSNAANAPVTSVGATLAVNAPPVIVSQPAAQTALVGSTVTFTVGATGTPVPFYQWRVNGVNIVGATSPTLTLTNVQNVNAANYDVLVNNGIGGGVSSLAQLTVVTAATAPVITQAPAPRTVVAGSSAVLTVGVSAAPAPTYQWRKGGVDIAGATGPTLTLSNLQLGDSTNYDVRVTNSAGSVTSSPAAITVVRRSFAGAYFGTLGSGLGNFAFYVRGDNTGLFLAYLPGSNSGVRFSDFSVTDTGLFNFFQGALSITGVISDTGVVTGSAIGVVNAPLSGSKSPESGSTAGLAGIYQAGAANTSSTAYAVVGSAGQAFVLIQTSTTFDGGQNVVDSNNRVTISTARQSIVATITPDTSLMNVVVTPSSGSSSTVFNGAGETVLASQRLANISTRARVGSGDAVAIAGFVISGQSSKPVLIRAIGPTLATLGVSTALSQPKLELFRANGTLVASNTGWTTSGNTAALEAASVRAGAFALGANAADSVILATLAPGAYTAVISSANATPGVALAEVYDLSAPAAGQKLFNISTRASTGAGDSVLTAGVVVSGSAPKRVLIRGVGPTLTSLGVTGALAQPQLTVIKDNVTVATNSNWTSSPDATAIASASAQVGAFALGASSADAAMIVSLAPGNYSVQLTGANNTAGIAIIEVYELP